MSVSKRVKIQGVWKFKTAVEVDGRIVQHMVLVDGNVQRHPEGHYYYRLNEGKWVKLDACPESNKKARERVQVHARSRTWFVATLKRIAATTLGMQ